MVEFLVRKIRLYPLASTSIVVLVCGILALESGALFPERPADNQLTAIPQNTENGEVPPTAGQVSPEIVDVAPRAPSPPIQEEIDEKTVVLISGIDPVLGRLMADGNYAELREELLKRAANAVASRDNKKLGYILNLLGQIAIYEQELSAAEVYLTEALDIFTQLEDEIGSAQIYLQLGRVHLKSRQIARVAGTAYDELQVGRWYLANGLFDEAESYIRQSIERNLSINRYGSAASAYESLARLFLQNGDTDGAVREASEAARMFASAGRGERAQNVLGLARKAGISRRDVNQVESQISRNMALYKEEILQVERAKDYQRLYNYYTNLGDHDRAWHFRLLAGNSLSQVSKRTLFHRQQGVLAILFNSNDDVDQAEDYFSQARFTFDTNGLLELSDETHTLQEQVY